MNKDHVTHKSVPRRIALAGLAAVLVLLAILCLASLTSADAPPVAVEQEAEPDQVLSGASTRYTAVFSNSTDADVSMLTIVDTLPTDFAFDDMAANSDISDPSDVTGDRVTWTGPFTVKAHGTLDLAYNVDVDAPASATPYENDLEAVLSTGETISDSAAVQVIEVDLSGTKMVSADEVYPGDPLNYTVVFVNDGTQDVTLTSITDELPDGFSFSKMVSGPLPDPTDQDGHLVWSGPFTIQAKNELRFTYEVIASIESGTNYQNEVEAYAGDTVVASAEVEVTVLPETRYAYLPLVVRTEPVEPPPPPPADDYLLAFDAKMTDNYEVYTISPDGTGLRNVSNLPGGDLDPTWAGDGTRLAWVHYYDGRGEVMASKADGSDLANLTNNVKDDRNPDWSPDSTKIAFDTYRDDRWEVYTMNADGSNQTRLTSQLCQSHDPIWSPDGTRIVFTCGLNDLGEIYVMNADGSNQIRRTNNLIPETALSWSPDSTRVVYVLNEKRTDSELYYVNVNTGDQVQLTDNEYNEYAPDWSPDGTKIAFSTNRTGNYEIFTMNVDGTNLVNLTNAEGADYVPKWSPDGQMISFISTRDGNKELYVMNADGSNQRRLTNTAEDETEHVWQPVIP
jgi:uncharacterized repeat protein (TIGR01451 family)